MKKISTATGDEGTTGLRGGRRVPKDDLRIETNGQIDQLNACLGLVRAAAPTGWPHRQWVLDVQRELMALMSHIATPEGQTNPRPLAAASLTAEMETIIGQSQVPTGFVVPGDGLFSAYLHLARTQARTVERRLWTLQREHSLPGESLVMMNRLSDCLFVLALQAAQTETANNNKL